MCGHSKEGKKEMSGQEIKSDSIFTPNASKEGGNRSWEKYPCWFYDLSILLCALDMNIAMAHGHGIGTKPEKSKEINLEEKATGNTINSEVSWVGYNVDWH